MCSIINFKFVIMKKLFFTAGFLLIGAGVFASNETIVEKKATQTEFYKGDPIVKVTCTRRGKDSHGQSVVITSSVDSTGDFAIDMGNACSKAAAVVKLAVALLEQNPN
jgi:hypothetical protein